MDLLQRFAHGEIDAFETLVRQFQGDIYVWTVRIVRDPGVAEDLTVETLWRVYRARHRFRPDGKFGAWARRIATNLAIDHLRRNRPEQSFLAEPAGVQQPDPLVRSEIHERIQQAFRRLPAKLQVAATLALVEELPYDEIASALETSVGAVKLRVFRAVRILRKRLSQAGIRPE
jgi:RNA polymerase sigma-70 factor (ECF subfamily)